MSKAFDIDDVLIDTLFAMSPEQRIQYNDRTLAVLSDLRGAPVDRILIDWFQTLSVTERLRVVSRDAAARDSLRRAARLDRFRKL